MLQTINRIRLAKREFQVNTVFDVGANIGAETRKVAEAYPNAKFYCFEPFPSTYEKLVHNLIGYKHINCFNEAFGRNDGYAHMKSTGSSEMNRITSDKNGIEIRMSSISSFCQANNVQAIDYLKIDTEGHDMDVLIGCYQFISQIQFIQCEVSMNEYNKYHVSFQKIFSYLACLNFSIFGIFEQALEWGNGGYPILRRADVVFVNNLVVGDMKGVITHQ
ncbi:FkbM family methyltransferase [Skermanella aerolata]|uniref:FkbM family methyltransferase n=1 Tax=Skermanella aerolata TaxID=393310 RepID=UPI003D19AC50